MYYSRTVACALSVFAQVLDARVLCAKCGETGNQIDADAYPRNFKHTNRYDVYLFEAVVILWWRKRARANK